MEALKMMGLGAAQPLPDSVVNYQVPIPAGPTTKSTGSGLLDWLIGAGNTVKDAVDKYAPAVQTATNLIDQIKSGNTAYNPNLNTTQNNQPPYLQPAQTFWQQHGTKVVIGGGILAATAIGVYALKDSKKKK